MKYSVQAAEELFYMWADDEGILVDSQECFDALFDQYCDDNGINVDWSTLGIQYAPDGSIIQ